MSDYQREENQNMFSHKTLQRGGYEYTFRPLTYIFCVILDLKLQSSLSLAHETQHMHREHTQKQEIYTFFSLLQKFSQDHKAVYCFTCSSIAQNFNLYQSKLEDIKDIISYQQFSSVQTLGNTLLCCIRRKLIQQLLCPVLPSLTCTGIKL